MIFQGLAPTEFGDLAGMTGRRPTYILGFIIYIGANVGLALQNNYAALLVLRCLQSTGSSGTVAMGNGVVADIASSGERGKFMGIAQFGPMAAPAIAPAIGGILTQFLGWRWLFWFLTILAVVYLIPLAIAFPETGRNVVGNRSIPPPAWNMSLLNYLKTRKAEHGDALSAKQAGFKIDIKRGDNMRHFPLEKARIQVFIVPLYIGIAAILCSGWVMERNAPLAAPLVLSFIIGLCLTGSFNVMSTMLVYLYPLSPATATAANNLVRCLMGAAAELKWRAEVEREEKGRDGEWRMENHKQEKKAKKELKRAEGEHEKAEKH
ncbi:hypothetical protein OEA41_003114 [Lepraria neglecta]|uniref:Major facilitator superfamily (MFS) profile domain-containing protein n=1 Tax=Lepraria neglecta TaxID=209136 RepID=A0AAD9Z451_9LECA|nr:hypothetical protein OEA41_003114 [Lepraria neglecta]